MINSDEVNEKKQQGRPVLLVAKRFKPFFLCALNKSTNAERHHGCVGCCPYIAAMRTDVVIIGRNSSDSGRQCGVQRLQGHDQLTRATP